MTRKIQPDITKSGANRNDPRLGGFPARDSIEGIVASPDANYDPRPIRNACIVLMTGVAGIVLTAWHYHLSSGAVYILLLAVLIVSGVIWNRS
jgi:hypothetical protein